MTTEDNPKEQTNAKCGAPPEATQRDDCFTQADPVLQRMAGFADRARAGIGVNLVLSGSIISGTICSGEEFFEWAGETRRSVPSHPEPIMKEADDLFTKVFFDTTANAYRELRESLMEDSEVDDTKQRYIHLRDAVVVNGPHMTKLSFARVLLSQVNAWTIGQMIFSTPAS